MEHPMVARYPGARVPAARVHAHVAGDAGADSVLAVHLTRYPVEMPHDANLPEEFKTHLAAVTPPRWEEIEPNIAARSDRSRDRLLLEWLDQERLLEVASVVIARCTEQAQTPLLALDAAMGRYVAATAVGVVVDERTCLVGLRTRRFGDFENKSGYSVTMTAVGREPGPVALYPSALLGWSRWWREHVGRVRERLVEGDELPAPPPELDVVEAWKPYRVQLEAAERMAWPDLPVRRWPWGDDYDLL